MAKPFVPWPRDPPFLRRWEGKASELRRLVVAEDDDPLDPFALVDALDSVCAASVEDLPGISIDKLRELRRHKAQWWALAYREGAGPWLILYHPWQSTSRLRVTILEEVAHIHLGHRPSRVFTDPATGLPTRSYGKSTETEAYGVAAATLVPFVGLTRMLASGATTDEIAETYGASRSLVEYRMNTTKAKLAAERLRRRI